MNFQENVHKDTVLFSLFHTTGCMALTSFIDSVAFDHLGKIVSAKILPVKFLLLLTHTHLKLYPINLVYNSHCCAILMTFSIFFIPCTLIIWNSSVKRFNHIHIFKLYLSFHSNSISSFLRENYLCRF